MQKTSFKEVKVSVILPSLNVADYIKECIESVLRQSLQEIEIICVDAGSTDGTFEILQRYADQDNRMKLLCSSVKSYGKQVNMGIEIANGEYIAVVETDDYIESKMYEVLYHTAKENDADYVKADFDDFFFLRDGQKLFQNVRLLSRCPNLYGKSINVGQYLFLFERDYNIWSGIYKKNFLTKKQIRLNETAGAAFQDIGFMQQVLCYADHAVYINDSFYRYRIDRDASSSFSPRGLMFAYQEFKWLFEMCSIGENIDAERLNGMYRRMAQVFFYEYNKLIQNKDVSQILSENGIYFTWFQEELKKAVDMKILKAEDFEESIWAEIRLFIKNERSYADYKTVKNLIYQEARHFLIDKVKNASVVIFGSGVYGIEAYKLFSDYGVEVRAFCDNNKSKWGRYIGNTQIKAMEKCIEEYQEVYYIIANKNSQNEIREQLHRAGIADEKILRFR